MRAYYKKTTRVHRTGNQMDNLLTSIQGILRGEESQITIRHLFYRLVGLHLIEKTEAAYKSLCGHLSKWRRLGDILWGAFTDRTRWDLRKKTVASVKEAFGKNVGNFPKELLGTSI